jgi:two-component system, NtrC family, sensor kinase
MAKCWLAPDPLGTLSDDPVVLKSIISDLQNQVDRILLTVSQVPATPQSALPAHGITSLTFLHQLLDSIPDPVFVKDEDHRWVMVNQAYCQLMEVDGTDCIGKTDYDVLPQEQAELEWMMDEHIYATEMEDISEAYRLDSNGHPQYLSTKKICFVTDQGEKLMVGVIRDMTDRKQIEDKMRESDIQSQLKTQQLGKALKDLQRTQLQLIQSEKMSSLGQLVAGIAHEINNPVNFIHGNLGHAQKYLRDLLLLLSAYREYRSFLPESLEQLESDLDVDFILRDLPKLMASMESGTDRIQGIVSSLQTFSRLDESACKFTDVHEGLDSAIRLLQSRLQTDTLCQAIAIEQDYDELPLVECYASELNQVFMNLLVNAIDALASRQAALLNTRDTFVPIISIKTQQLKDAVLIQISDNGIGIPLDVQSRVFDPFFTTKAIGQGTGMGLPLSYQVITDRHQGSLTFSSAYNEGTIFTIRIPLKQKIS